MEIKKISDNKIKVTVNIFPKRKSVQLDTSPVVYSFDSFDDFCLLQDKLTDENKKFMKRNFTKQALFSYKNKFYFCFVPKTLLV